MKSNLKTKEQKAIQHFCEKYGAIPQMSIFPNIRFKIRKTDKEVVKSLAHLIYEYEQDVDESKKAELSEKKRKEREEKWKPITERR